MTEEHRRMGAPGSHGWRQVEHPNKKRLTLCSQLCVWPKRSTLPMTGRNDRRTENPISVTGTSLPASEVSCLVLVSM